MESSLSLHRHNRLSLCKEVESSGYEMAPCSACRSAKPKEDGSKPRCIVGAKSSRCSECIRKGYVKCNVTLSRPEWMRLRDLREKYRKELVEAEEEEAALLERLSRRKAKTARLRKQLIEAEERTAKAVAKEVEDTQVADELDELLDGVEIPGQPFEFHGILEMPPDDWGLIDGGNPADPVEVPESPRL